MATVGESDTALYRLCHCTFRGIDPLDQQCIPAYAAPAENLAGSKPSAVAACCMAAGDLRLRWNKPRAPHMPLGYKETNIFSRDMVTRAATGEPRDLAGGNLSKNKAMPCQAIGGRVHELAMDPRRLDSDCAGLVDHCAGVCCHVEIQEPDCQLSRASAAYCLQAVAQRYRGSGIRPP